jgi:hypothetical protein
MPFKKIKGTNKYKSPSGKVWTVKAMKWWLANHPEDSGKSKK